MLSAFSIEGVLRRCLGRSDLEHEWKKGLSGGFGTGERPLVGSNHVDDDVSR